MRLPFGLDLISLLVGMALYAFVLPWLMGMLNRGKTAPTA
jgi:hypothetical protein